MSQYNHNDDNFIYCIGTYFDKATMVSFFRFISKSDKSTEEKWVPMNYLYKNIYFKEAVETYLSNIQTSLKMQNDFQSSISNQTPKIEESLNYKMNSPNTRNDSEILKRDEKKKTRLFNMMFKEEFSMEFKSNEFFLKSLNYLNRTFPVQMDTIYGNFNFN